MSVLYHSSRVFEVQAVEGGHPFANAVAQGPPPDARSLMKNSGGTSKNPTYLDKNDFILRVFTDIVGRAVP